MMEIELTTFTASEAERITGVNVARQRDWRRHGFLRRHEGQARHHLGDLGAMLLIQTLSELGIGPATFEKHIKELSGEIAFHALHEKGAIVGDWKAFEESHSIPPPSRMNDNKKKDMIKRAKERGGDDAEKVMADILSDKSRQRSISKYYAAYYACKKYGITEIPINFPEGSSDYMREGGTYDIFISKKGLVLRNAVGNDDIYDKSVTDPENYGAFVFISLVALSRLIEARAKHPFGRIL